MADVYLLDESFSPRGVIDAFNSLLWNKKYYDTGNFELHCSAEYAGLLQSSKYVTRNDDTETGIIEEFGYVSDSTGDKVVVKGRFIKALLADRVIDSTQKFDKIAASEILKSLVTTYCVNPAVSTRRIPKLVVAQSAPLGAIISTQITGDGLLEAIERIGKEQQLSANISYDFVDDRLVFDVWQGLDRTQNQTTNPWATFSEDFENIATAEYNKTKDFKNYAYVAGAGEGAARIIELVDQVKAGEDRKELYVDARDLQNTDNNGNPIPDATYRQTLRQRGLEKLAEYQQCETVETKIDTTSNLAYRRDYDLGDVVTYINNDIGLVVEQRITEIYEAIESGNQSIEAVFGNEKPGIMKAIKREVI